MRNLCQKVEVCTSRSHCIPLNSRCTPIGAALRAKVRDVNEGGVASELDTGEGEDTQMDEA